MRIAGNSVWSNASCQSASVVASRSAPLAVPTLLMTTSMRPNSLIAVSIDFLIAGFRGDIGSRECDARAGYCGLLQGLSGRLQRLFPTRADDDVRAFRDQRVSCREPEPAAAAGHDRNLACQSQRSIAIVR